MVRVAVCLPCEKEMLEVELFDHIEIKSHKEQFKNLPSFEEYLAWFKRNIIVEDREMPPNQSAWLKDVHSFGIETRMRHG